MTLETKFKHSEKAPLYFGNKIFHVGIYFSASSQNLQSNLKKSKFDFRNQI